MQKLLFLLIFPLILRAYTTEEEGQFQSAKNMFNPWYSGPLLPGGAHMMPPGHVGVQPYFFVADNFAKYNSHHQSYGIPDLLQLNPQINAIQIGITHWMDASIGVNSLINWKDRRGSGSIGDITLTLGFPLLKEGPSTPAMKIGIGEIFPTGRYQKFTPDKAGVQATGQGSCITVLSYRIAKIFFWSAKQPLNVRATISYTIPTILRVQGFNAYGGGFCTCGEVRPGNQLNITIGTEWNFAPKWVFVNDVVYIHNSHSKFTGWRGHTGKGLPASAGRRSSEQLSIAPTIEYNPTPKLGFLTGVWFTITGRNTFNFIQGIFGATYTWSAN